MQSPLHEYQRQAVRFALDAFASDAHGCGLFLEPGLGKTLASIAIMDMMRAEHPGSRFLVVAPKLVAVESWPGELEHWRDMHSLDWAVCVGTEKERLAALKTGAAVTVINQENVAWLDATVRDWPWTGMVVDELSGYRTPRSHRGLILRRRAGHMDWVLGLTGTPATKDLLDLWGEIAVIDRKARLGRSMTAFKTGFFRESRFIIQGGQRRAVGWEPLPGATETILKAIEPFCLSMSAAERLPGLPPMIAVDHWLDMPDATRGVYDTLRRDMVADLADRTVTVANAGVLTAKLSQLTCGVLYPDTDDPDRTVRRLDDAKLDALDMILADADGPVLVFYQFTEELRRMAERIPGLREVHEKGVLDEWRAGRVPVLAAQPAAAKYGLNIQGGGHEIVWTSLPWSLDDYRQACDRLHRQGQTDTVRVHRLLESGTVDRRKLDVLQGREALHEAVMDALAGD